MRAQDRRLLLADRVAEGVRLWPGEATQCDGGRHDVFLVDEDPVRLLEVRLEQRVQVGDRLLPVLPADVGGNVVHRSRPEEGDERRKVVDRGRSQVADVAPHAGRLELEDAGRLARGQQLERPGVVERNRFEVDVHPSVGTDKIHGTAQDREVGQAQEIELQQAQRLDRVHLELGHERVRVRCALEGHELCQRLARDHDSGRMR